MVVAVRGKTYTSYKLRQPRQMEANRGLRLSLLTQQHTEFMALLEQRILVEGPGVA